MALLAIPVAPPRGGTTIGGCGVAAIATGSWLRPSHYRPRWCLYRIVRAFPVARLLRCRGLHLSRGRYRRRRTWHGRRLTPSSCFQKIGDAAREQA